MAPSDGDPLSRWLEGIIAAEDLRAHIPILGSCDTRHSEDPAAGTARVCVVDPNRYPQGFNNVWDGDFGAGCGARERREKCVLRMEADAAALLKGRISRDLAGTSGPQHDPPLHRIHVVHENYPDPTHPFYRNLGCLKRLLRATYPDEAAVALTHSLRRVLARRGAPRGDSDSAAPAAGSGDSGTHVVPAPGVYNLLNTSYPSDMLDVSAPHDPWGEPDSGASGDHETHSTAAVQNTGPGDTNARPGFTYHNLAPAAEPCSRAAEDVRPPANANASPLLVLADDPEWYNSYHKSGLYELMHGWLVQMPDEVRRYVDGDTAVLASAAAAGSRGCYDVHACPVTIPDAHTRGMEAGFAEFPRAVTKENKHELGALLGHLLVDPAALKPKRGKNAAAAAATEDADKTGRPADATAPPMWTKVFVKDEHGCNGVGVCVFGLHGKDAVKVSSETGVVRVSREHRHTLRVRGAKTRELVEHSARVRAAADAPMTVPAMVRVDGDGAAGVGASAPTPPASSGNGFSLQEGIPSTLRNAVTGAVLEVVLMFADGRLYNYFVREGPVAAAPPPQEGSSATPAPPTDTCNNLNVAGVRFVQRPEFESDPAYAEAFAQVRRRWQRYVCIGRLAMLAMAKQKQVYAATARYRRTTVHIDPTQGIGGGGESEDDDGTSTWATSTVQGGTATHTASEPGGGGGGGSSVAAAPTSSKQVSIPIPLAPEKFSRDIGGVLMQTLNKHAAEKGLQAVKIAAAGGAVGEGAKKPPPAQPAAGIFRKWAKEFNKMVAQLEGHPPLEECIEFGGRGVAADDAAAAHHHHREVLRKITQSNRQGAVRRIVADAVALIVSGDGGAVEASPGGGGPEGAGGLLLSELLGTTDPKDDPATAARRAEFYRVQRVVWGLVVRCQLLYREVVHRTTLEDFRRGEGLDASTPLACIPTALVPTPAPGMDALRRTSRAIALALDAVCCDPGWLFAQLAGAARADPWLRGLVALARRVYAAAEGRPARDPSAEPRLMLTRQDYLPGCNATSSTPAWKQVEVNTIAVAFAGVASEVAAAHDAAKGVISQGTPLYNATTGVLPGARAGYAEALVAAHEAYTKRRGRSGQATAGPPPRICFFVFADDHLEADQRWLQREVNEKHLARAGADTGATSICFSAVYDACDVSLVPAAGAGSTAPPTLFVDGAEVSVAYFHTTYSPGHFVERGAPAAAADGADVDTSQRLWARRAAIESASCVKAPTLLAQLAGTKRVQQVLLSPSTASGALLTDFLSRRGAQVAALYDAGGGEGDMITAEAAVAAAVADIQRAVVWQVDPSEAGTDAAAGEAVAEALKAGEGGEREWVLKPQREGGGHNYYGRDVARVLKEGGLPSAAQYTLMERIATPATPSALLPAAGHPAVWNVPTVSELGLFNVLVADGSDIASTVDGAFMRTKAAGAAEGGVCAGHGYITSCCSA